MIDALISLIQDVISPLQWSLSWVNILEIAFIAVILLVFYQKFIKNTQSEKLVKGLFFLVFAWIFSEILILIDLRIIGVFFKSLVTLISLSLIVIFQPELRRLLGYLGQPGFIRKTFFTSGSFRENDDNEIDDDDFDEENIMLALYAKSLTNAKLITKVHRISYDEIIDSLDVGSIIYPKYITAESIIKYVRAMKNSIGSNIETLYRLNDNRVEALELLIKEDSPMVGKPLSELRLKPNVLIGCITRRGQVTIPNGQSVIHVGDTIILITTTTGFHQLEDALM